MSKATRRVLLVNSSWEERFWKVIPREIREKRYDIVGMINASPPATLAEPYRDQLRQACREVEITLMEEAVDLLDPHSLPNLIGGLVDRIKPESKGMIVDYSTMPREILWHILTICRVKKLKVQARYFRPARYAKDWLSCNPIAPRLVLGHSGLSKLGRRTALCVIPGFDLQRTIQMLYYYEPAVTHVLYQPETHFKHQAQGVLAHLKLLGETGIGFESRSIQFYDRPLSDVVNELQNVITPLLEEYNVIIASLGPKPSAVAVYELWRRNRQLALCYSTSREFNPRYSVGVAPDAPLIYEL